MAIRKTGAVTGQVIGFGQEPGTEGISATGALGVPECEQSVNWTGADEGTLAAENKEADRE